MPSSFAIGDHFEDLIEQLIDTGRYQSKSEVVREGLRLLEEREQERRILLDKLRASIDESIRIGGYQPAEKVFARLRKKYEKMAKARER